MSTAGADMAAGDFKVEGSGTHEWPSPLFDLADTLSHICLE